MKDKQAIAEVTEHEIDIVVMIKNMLKGLKRFGFIIIILAIITSSAACLISKRYYDPRYTAAATFAVKLNRASDGSMYEDNFRASQMSASFPYIITSGVLKNIIAANLGVEQVDEKIWAENVEDTNLFTIKVTSGEAKWAYNVLQSVIENYPKVAETVVGSTHLDMIEETGIPKKADNPLNYVRSIGVGALPGAGLGILIILLYALTRKTIHKPDDFKAISNIKYLGALPKVELKKRGKNKNQSVSIRNDRFSSFREHIYRIRTRVEKVAAGKEMKTILVTSAIPSEGKSTVAMNLSLVLAEEGKKVILVDCDLHHPTIKDLLSLEDNYKGIEMVLNENADLEETIGYIDEMKISVLACSKPVSNSSELIGTNKIRDLLNDLKERFDYVILDTPPSSILSDTSDLAKYVDGAIYVIKQDYAKVNQILEGLEHLSDSSNIDMIGFVFNCAKGGFGNYGYGYGYGRYGYGYGHRKHDHELVAGD